MKNSYNDYDYNYINYKNKKLKYFKKTMKFYPHFIVNIEY